ncbi:uncharacterized protein DS421_13g412580 [Arachis hypogaea]|nr:uncharacterized protein DS421_13g412580 [Arachis hypogaea]
MELLEEDPAPSAMPCLCLSFALASTSAVLFCIAVHVRHLLYVVVSFCSVIHGGAPLRHRRLCSSAIASSDLHRHSCSCCSSASATLVPSP